MLRLLGVLGEGETASASQLADALDAVNVLLDSWSNDNLLCIAIVREEFTLTAGQSSRTMGPSGNFNTTRPIDIENATIEDQSASPTAEYPLTIIGRDEYAAITQK